jgi:glycosyltransferase involved in cell wall biosynthesis
MAAMDLFVLPSVNEGMGRVLLEAGAAACPAVASAVGGVPDIVRQNETGILVEPGSVAMLSDAVLALVQDPEKRKQLGQRARRTVVPAYGLEPMVARIEALYEELIREKGLDA